MSTGDNGQDDDGVVDLKEMRRRTDAERRRRRKASNFVSTAGDRGDETGAGSGDAPAGQRTTRKIVEPRGALDLMRVLTQVGYVLARDPDGNAMIRLQQDPNRSWHPVGGQEFSEKISNLYRELASRLTPFGRLPGMTTENCIKELQRTLRAESRQGHVLPFASRYIEMDGKKYIDWGLQDDARMMVVTEHGWKFDAPYTEQRPRADIPLIRSSDMLALAKPIEDRAEADKGLRLFERRSGLSQDGFKLLMLAIGHAWSDGPGPIVALVGPPAAHKTTLAATVQRLVDPTRNRPGHMPGDAEDLVVALRSSSCPAFDNRTEIMNAEMEDILCEAVTGGALLQRKFFTRGDLSRLMFQPKLILLASTNQLIRRDDLGTRSLMLEMQPRPHLPDDVIDREVQFICACVVTKLLDGAVMELRNRNRDYPDVDGRLNRFERNARARAEAFGWDDAEIAALFKRAQRDLRADIAEQDIMVAAVLPYLRKKMKEPDILTSIEARKPLVTTAGELWGEIVDSSSALRSRDSGFPTDPSAFRRRLGARLDVFAAAGFHIKFGPRTSAVRPILISCQGPVGASAWPPSATPSAEPPPQCPICGGTSWWRAKETGHEWQCHSCVAMPMVVHDLQQWPEQASTRH